VELLNTNGFFTSSVAAKHWGLDHLLTCSFKLHVPMSKLCRLQRSLHPAVPWVKQEPSRDIHCLGEASLGASNQGFAPVHSKIYSLVDKFDLAELKL